MVLLSGKKQEKEPKECTKTYGDLGYKFKTILRILPEYELYHMWFGKPDRYDETILNIIKEGIAKKIPHSIIKSKLIVCQI
jgi:hypothetical protein